MGRPAKSYSQAVRLQLLRESLEANRQITVAQVVERFGVTRRTIYRDLGALQQTGLPLFAEGGDDGRAIWRLHPSVQSRTFTLTTAQLMALFFGRAAFRFLEGTLLHEELETVFARLRAGLRSKDHDLLRDLDRKLYVVGEAAKDYRSKDEVVDDILTGLLLNRCLRILYRPPQGEPRVHVVEPYTLLMHRFALYLIGRSRTRGQMRTFAVDRIVRSTWLRNRAFSYPADYSPRRHIDGAFGVLTGPAEQIAVNFAADRAPYAVERKWHPSQRIERLSGGRVRLTLRVAPSEEVVSWVLGFGGGAEVLRPASLRARIVAELKGALSQYRGVTSEKAPARAARVRRRRR